MTARDGQAGPGVPPEPNGEAERAEREEHAAVRVVHDAPAHGGRRLIAAAVLAPWLVGYGITGSWAVARGVFALAQGLRHIDAGYGRPVSPEGLVVVGALLLAAFAVLLATTVLLLTASRRRAAWIAVLAVAALLSAGAAWAGVAGRLHPFLWLVLFLGVLLAVVFSAVALARMPHGPRRATMAGP
jgi:hypothetical protein